MSAPHQKTLLALFARLTAAQQKTLVDFAEFLAARQSADRSAEPAAKAATPSPQTIPRPDSESVVKAIKRLAATYPMLDRSKMLNETSALMAQHVMQGRDAVEVIDELEIVFRTQYERYVEKQSRADTRTDE